ncbi:MAG: hypothetical protein IT537_12800 [Hyphomicrobiales bacterium]|nr:hypothetical protein [Hyphomicrobiales bacterium]
MSSHAVATAALLSTAIIVGAAEWSGTTRAQTADGLPTQAESDAFQGHAAEMQTRDETVEQRRRRLYFDDVDLEVGAQGLPCDHVAKSKPHAVAGSGFVVLLTWHTERARRARIWLPPGTTTTQAQAIEEAHTRIRHAGVAGEITLQDVQSFQWCK